MRFIITFLILLCSIFTTYSQEQSFERITTRNGLPSSNINNIRLDKDGYLWISTANHLVRYDGNNFTTHIVNRIVLDIDVNDKDGYLYGKDNFNFFKFNTRSNKYSPLQALGNTDDNPNNDQYNNIFIDSYNNVWSCDFNYIKRYNVSKNKFDLSYKLNEKNDNSNFAKFIEDSQKQLWFATNNGLYRLDASKGKLHNLINGYDFTSISLINNVLYLGSRNGRIFRYDINEKILSEDKFLQTKTAITFIIEENTESALVGTYGHLYRYNYKNSVLDEINIAEDKSLIYRRAIYDAKNKIIWIATDGGLLKYNLGKSGEIKKINLPRSLVEYPVNINAYKEIAANVFYLALSKSGLLKWNANLNTFQLLPFSKGENDDLSTISISEKNEVYIAGNKSVYRLMNNKLDKIISIDDRINSILIDKKNRLWILPHNKEILVYNPTTSQRLFILDKVHDKDYFTQNIFFDVLENKKGKVWFAAWFPKGYGICYYDETTKKIIDISTFNDHKLFIGDYFYSITQPKHSSSLAFTGYGGANIVDSNDHVIKRIDVTHEANNISLPLFSNCIIDTKGSHWLTTTEGLYYLSKDKNKIARITEYDGLTDNNVSKASLLSQDNKLLMSHINQIEILDISDIIENKIIPKVELSSVKILGANKQINLDSLSFERNENNLTLNFSTLTFNNPTQNNFQYKWIDNQDWIDNGNSNSITLSNLNHGHHTIQVKVGDNFGNWSKTPSSFTFYIKPYYYETLLFRSLAFISLLCALGYLIFYYIRKVKSDADQKLKIFELSAERNMAEKELEQTKEILKSTQLDALRSQMNPHFIFNSLNSIENFVLKNERMLASEYLGKFSKLIRNILDNSKSEIISLDKEIETIKLYIELEKIRTQNNFDVSYNISQIVSDDNISIPPMLMQPHIENAILHGIRYLEERRGHITISISITHDELLVYKLEDNGIGRTKSNLNKSISLQDHKSHGIDITSNRIELYNHKNNTNITCKIEDLFDAKNQPLGTSVTILIPLG